MYHSEKLNPYNLRIKNHARHSPNPFPLFRPIDRNCKKKKFNPNPFRKPSRKAANPRLLTALERIKKKSAQIESLPQSPSPTTPSIILSVLTIIVAESLNPPRWWTRDIRSNPFPSSPSATARRTQQRGNRWGHYYDQPRISGSVVISGERGEGVEGGKVIAASIAAIPRSLASREIQFNGRTCGKNPRGRGPDLSIHIVVEEFLIWIREGCVLIGICNAKNICNSVKVWSFCRSICDGVVSSLEIQRVVSEVFWDVSRFKYQICK